MLSLCGIGGKINQFSPQLCSLSLLAFVSGMALNFAMKSGVKFGALGS